MSIIRKSRIYFRQFATLLFSSIFLCLLTFSPSYAVDYHWFGGTGAWEEPSNWSPNGLPGLPFIKDTVTLTNDVGVNATAYFSGAGFPPVMLGLAC